MSDNNVETQEKVYIPSREDRREQKKRMKDWRKFMRETANKKTPEEQEETPEVLEETPVAVATKENA